MEPELVGEQVVYTSPTGTFRRVRRWYKGKQPQLHGQYTMGMTGWETVVDIDVVKATGKFIIQNT